MPFLHALVLFTRSSSSGRQPESSLASYRRKRTKAGFNLVEVVLAMCVIAIAFTSLFGVMPVALQNYRHAMSMTTAANILAKVSSDLQQTSADQINLMVGTAPNKRYFDDEGQDVTGTSHQGAALYEVDYRAIPAKTSVFNTDNPALIPITLDLYSVHNSVAAPTPLATKTLFIACPSPAS